MTTIGLILFTISQLSGGASISGSTTGAIGGPASILGCADVRAFGAKCDGATDDTLAIRAALASGTSKGVCVRLPPGKCKITATLTVPAGSALVGAGTGRVSSNQPYPEPLTQIDATGVTTVAIDLGAANDAGFLLDGFALMGQDNGSAPDSGSKGIHASSFTQRPIFRNLAINGFKYGMHLENTAYPLLHDVLIARAASRGLWIDGASGVDIYGSHFANCGGLDGGTQTAGNIVTTGAGASNITIRGSVIDEAFGGPNAATVFLWAGDRIAIYDSLIYGTDGGYGVGIGNGSTNPTNVLLSNVKVMSFGAEHSLYAIRLAGGSGHVLMNVVAVASGGGDVLDNATGTTWFNVNGRFKIPSIRTTYPGSGTNELWIDPTDALSTTYIRFAR